MLEETFAFMEFYTATDDMEKCKINRGFEAIIYNACHNREMESLLLRYDFFIRYANADVKYPINYLSTVLEEHRAILKRSVRAIRRPDRMPHKRIFSVPSLGENKVSTWNAKLAGDVGGVLRIRFPAAPFSLLSADQAQMFQQNFHTDQNQNDAAGPRSPCPHTSRRTYARRIRLFGKHKGRAPISVMATTIRTCRKANEMPTASASILVAIARMRSSLISSFCPQEVLFGASSFFSSNLPDHPATDKSQQSECDPVVKACNIGFKLPAERPAQNGIKA